MASICSDSKKHQSMIHTKPMMHKANAHKAFTTLLGSIVAWFILTSCATTGNRAFTITEAPESIRRNIVFYARQYAERETAFMMSGRPFLERNGLLMIDCSGLIHRVCQYAVNGTRYSLLFSEATVFTLYANFTSSVDKPEPGDFIFMGERNPPVHMAIFIYEDDDHFYFIDATLKGAEGIYPAVDGVTMRFYPKDDPRFLSFARLLVQY